MIGLKVPEECLRRGDGSPFERWWGGCLEDKHLSFSGKQEVTATVQLNSTWMSLQELLADAKKHQPTKWHPRKISDCPAKIFFSQVKKQLSMLGLNRKIVRKLSLHIALGTKADVLAGVDYFFELIDPQVFCTIDLSVHRKGVKSDVNLTLRDITSFQDEVVAKKVASILKGRYIDYLLKNRNNSPQI